MRKWLARKLFDLAARLDYEGTVSAATAVVLVHGGLWSNLGQKKKIGRPLGSKDKAPRNKANMGRPKGSNNKSPSRKNKSPSRKVQS